MRIVVIIQGLANLDNREQELHGVVALNLCSKGSDP